MQRDCTAGRQRDSSFAALYRQEAQRMRMPDPPRTVTPDSDRLVLLPILLLLLTEGADMRLILALLYILL